MSRTFKCKAFYEGDWSSLTDNLRNQIEGEIKSLSREYLLGVSEAEYVSHVVDKFTFEPLVLIKESEVIATPQVKRESVRMEPGFHYYGEPHATSREVYEINVSYRFTGTPLLFKLQPSSWTMTTTEISVSPESSTVSFNITVRQKNAEEFERAKADAYRRAFTNLEGGNNEARNWNASLQQFVTNVFKAQKQHLLEENDFFAAIKVKANPGTATVFSVPLIEKKKIPQPTIPTGTTFASQPTFHEATYKDILELLQSIGRSMEQKPSLYLGKDEEAVRDHFLTFLETRYEGTTATGETFNRSGKTDILLKYKDGTNLFVAECKFWSGPSGMHDAISQLFDRYLTWHDSKTAVLLFVKNKDFTSVLNTIEAEAVNHKYFTRLVGKPNQTAIDLIFHLPQDSQKTVQLRIMAFHFDKY